MKSFFGKTRVWSILLLLLFLQGCGGISMLSTKKRTDIYRVEFLKKIEQIKGQYRQGYKDEALAQLKAISVETLKQPERSMRLNLIGVIHFSTGNYETAIFNFNQAISSSEEDPSLRSQIYLNLASSYYKLEHHEKSYESLVLSNYKTLHPREVKKYHQLHYELAKKLGKRDEAVLSLTLYLSDKKQISELKSDLHFEKLLNAFFSMGSSEKLKFLEDTAEEKALVVGYLAYLEAEKLYYNGKKDDGKDVLEWIEKSFENQPEAIQLVKNFHFRIENFGKIDLSSVGVILPLSGEKEGYGKRALYGVDSALAEKNGALLEGQKPYRVFVKDSKGSGAVGAYQIRQLIENNYVTAIIGGLYSKEATKEYLEAKRHGVLFISLSQIYLPKEEKDHLLVEIDGSVESQVNQILSSSMLENFGKRGAIIYPRSERGRAYVNEFWRKSQATGVTLTGVLAYDKKLTDFRDPVRNLLGLKFPRERKEELDLLSEIHSLEKRNSARRIQHLKPQVDFDWVFIPARPREALQLIPSFSYFDAFGLNLIGGPSWRSQRLSRESSKLGHLYFIGDDVEETNNQFTNKFLARYKKRPKLIEMRAYDSLHVAASLLK
ncbi:MAG: ABC transporter substrate-binding protein, partial [Halobacteriovoraceae bacterium]|nr:ABC transporter substrate-binding protein [Halobacteriovoraceae bacterium]